MNHVVTLDLAEAAWYLKSGLELEGVVLRPSTVNPAQAKLDLVFFGERTHELSEEWITGKATISRRDVAVLNKAIGMALIGGRA